MKNPWEEISLSDSEDHMKLNSVMQLQALSKMMKGQFNAYPVSSIMILGIAGGNGLEHIAKDRFDTMHVFDRLEQVHRQMEKRSLEKALTEIEWLRAEFEKDMRKKVEMEASFLKSSAE